MAKNIKNNISAKSGFMTREEIEADFNRHSEKAPHSQAAMSRSYELRRSQPPAKKREINTNHPLKRTPKVDHSERDLTLRNYARKDPHLAARIEHDDTMRNLYEKRMRKEAQKSKLGIFLSIAFSIPFFLNMGEGQLTMKTDLLYAMALAGIILFGPLRKRDTAIKGVILTFLAFFIIFVSSYWETGHQIASEGGIEANSFIHLLTVTPLKYILISVLIGAIFYFYEKIGSSASSLYHARR